MSDLGRSRDFYERVIGLRGAEGDDEGLALGIAGERALLELHADPAAPALDHTRTGLFHLAVLLPTRRDLALALGRLAEARWPLGGTADHLVSEALYLSDPDGNGVEIYRDRAAESWPRAGGRLEMPTIGLDLDGLVSELAGPGERAEDAPRGTKIGHVHLQVADLDQAEAFYAGVLGFDVTVRGYRGALFLSAGGYHHHIGLNTWHSAGAAPPIPGSIGLRSFEVTLPDRHELERTLASVRAAGVEVEAIDGSSLVHDPSGNGVVLTADRG